MKRQKHRGKHPRQVILDYAAGERLAELVDRLDGVKQQLVQVTLDLRIELDARRASQLRRDAALRAKPQSAEDVIVVYEPTEDCQL